MYKYILKSICIKKNINIKKKVYYKIDTYYCPFQIQKADINRREIRENRANILYYRMEKITI